MESKVKYLEDNYKVFERPVKRHGGILNLLPGQSKMGYGRKIATDHMLQTTFSNRKYRIYAIQISNAGSLYIVRNGEHLFLKGI